MRDLCRNLTLVALGFIAHPSSAFGQICSVPPNPIVRENCLSGNPISEWDDITRGRIDDPRIEGFAVDISFNVGDRVDFKIRTDATRYTIDIYRMGYYSGMGARRVASISPSATLPQIQPACIEDSTTRLLDCGNWNTSASWTIPADATSGIYFARIARPDTLGASHVVFVVRNDASDSDLLFQTSDLTWQAYNDYGPSTPGSTAGGSLYGTQFIEFDLPSRAKKVSYNRPFHTREMERGVSWVFYSEYPMVRWLEANGYDVTYFSGVDTERNGSLIARHKVFLSVGHDEYWSGDQRDNVKAARAAGVNLAFFSGNEVFWKTRWENDVDGRPYRTLVCYKETLDDAVTDPLDPPIWTGTWRDPRFSPPADGGRPENALTGTLFMVNGPSWPRSIIIPAADGKMRFWRNTTVAEQISGEVALPAGSLGYEWDVDADNRSRPAGLFHQSSATYHLLGIVLQDFGGVYGDGTVTHNLTLYRFPKEALAPNGSLVFGAGTVQWSWGLDTDHDDPNLESSFATADVRMKQATVNLFADMGVQPANLQLEAGVRPATQTTDSTPPSSTITSPVSGATVVVGDTVIITGTATDFGGGVVGGVEVSVDGGTRWHPAEGRANWTYLWIPAAAGTVNIRSRGVDDSGNLETPSAGTNVIVEPRACPCSIRSSATTSGSSESLDANAGD